MKLPRWFWILAFLVCWPTFLFAEPVLHAQNGDSLTLHQTTCEDSTILAYIVANGAGHLLEQFKKATLVWHGQVLKSCWVEHEGLVYSIDEAGDKLQPIPRSAFRENTI